MMKAANLRICIASLHSHLCYASLISKVTRNVNVLYRYGTLPFTDFHSPWFVGLDGMAWPKARPGWLAAWPGAILKHDPDQHLPIGTALALKYGSSHCEHMSHLLKNYLRITQLSLTYFLGKSVDLPIAMSMSCVCVYVCLCMCVRIFRTG